METIYIDRGAMDGAIGIIFSRGQDVEVICTGLEVLTEHEGPETAKMSRLYGLDFFTRETEVPHMGFHLTGHRISRSGLTELEMVREKG